MKGKYKTLLDSLPLVAEMIGRTHGIKVIIGKMNTPCRIGKGEIHLPALDPDDEKTLVFARGWLDHEVGHVKHTAPNLKKGAGSEFCGELYNIVEDVRIENLMSLEYPGCRKNLDTSWAICSLSDEEKAKGMVCLADPAIPEWHPRAIIEGHILQRGRARVIGQSKPLATTAQTEKVIRQVFGEGFTDGLNVMLDETGSLRNSHEALDLAKRIEKYIIDQAGEPPPMPDANGSGEKESSEPGEDGSNESSSNAAGDSGKRSKKRQQSGGGTQADNGDSDDSVPTDSSKSNDGEDGKKDDEADGQGQQKAGERQEKSPDRSKAGKAKGQSGDEPSSETEPGDTGERWQPPSKPENRAARDALDTPCDAKSPWELIEEALTQASEEAAKDGRAVADGGQAVGSDYDERGLVGAPINAVEVYGKTAALRGRMAGLLQAITMKRRLPSKRGHRLVTRKLPLVPVGEKRIFCSHMRVKDADTLAAVLVDRSGSMHRNGAVALAMQAALGVCAGLSEIRGVKVACYAFPGTSGQSPVIPMVRFGESVRLQAHNFIPNANGGTPMANALWHVARATALEKEPRKIIIVATDGAPDYPEATRSVIQKFLQSGYEVMGIGIGINVSGLFPISQSIGDIGELSHAMFSMLTEAMIKFEQKAA